MDVNYPCLAPALHGRSILEASSQPPKSFMPKKKTAAAPARKKTATKQTARKPKASKPAVKKPPLKKAAAQPKAKKVVKKVVKKVAKKPVKAPARKPLQPAVKKAAAKKVVKKVVKKAARKVVKKAVVPFVPVPRVRKITTLKRGVPKPEPHHPAGLQQYAETLKQAMAVKQPSGPQLELMLRPEYGESGKVSKDAERLRGIARKVH